MAQLSEPNIESELSYAYLHAIASRAGMACNEAGRHEDNSGVDARIVGWPSGSAASYLTEVDFKIQLEATIATPAENETHLSYFVRGVDRYNDLRAETLSATRLLIVLFLPADSADWLYHTVEELALRRCAYWVSLRGAPATTNASGETVKIPKVQVFNAETLTELAERLSRGEKLLYVRP
jgi:uncharacterized protein DUF4365